MTLGLPALALVTTLAGCGGSSDRRSEFVGTWSYDTVTASTIDCGTNGVFTLTQVGDKTIGHGTAAGVVDLSVSLLDGVTVCAFEYDISGPVATVRTAQSCDLLGLATTTTTPPTTPTEAPNVGTISLTGPNAADFVYTAKLTDLPVPDPATQGATSIPGQCTYHVEAKLARVSSD